MVKLLFDTHAMIWFLNGTELKPEALFEIARAQSGGKLHVSPITAWEAALALQKTRADRRPDLNGQDAASWFSAGYREIGAKVIPIRSRIAIEASRVPTTAGHTDPGDCYIIATARVGKLTIVTRDQVILRLAVDQPDYVKVLKC